MTNENKQMPTTPNPFQARANAFFAGLVKTNNDQVARQSERHGFDFKKDAENFSSELCHMDKENRPPHEPVGQKSGPSPSQDSNGLLAKSETGLVVNSGFSKSMRLLSCSSRLPIMDIDEQRSGDVFSGLKDMPNALSPAVPHPSSWPAFKS